MDKIRVMKESKKEVKKSNTFHISDLAKVETKKNTGATFNVGEVTQMTTQKVEMMWFKATEAEAVRHINPDGTLGGYVALTALVAPTAYVGEDAQVYGTAQVRDNARILDKAKIFGHCIIAGSSEVSGAAEVSGGARVLGNSIVTDFSHVLGKAEVLDAIVKNEAWVMKSAFITDTIVGGSCRISVPCKIAKCDIVGNFNISTKEDLRKYFPQYIF